jgi:hypothetical protein
MGSFFLTGNDLLSQDPVVQVPRYREGSNSLQSKNLYECIRGCNY